MADSKGIWFLAGLGIGAAVGILYAPRAGDETRDLLGRKANESREAVTRKTAEFRQQAGQYVDRTKDIVSRQVDQFQAAVEAGKQAFRESSGGESTAGRG